MYIMCPLPPHMLIMRQGLQAKKPLHAVVRTGYHYLFNRLVCVSVPEYVCVTFVVFTYCESCTRPISTNPGSMEAGEYELTWDVFRRAVSRWSRSPGCCGFRRVFWVGRIFDEARARERSDRGPSRFLPIGKKASSYRGAYRVPLFN